MEKSTNKYYWIKLKTDFFNQKTIDFLMGQKNGCEYVVLYQMLCLQTANNNGEMFTQIGEIIVPYDIAKIVRDTKYFDTDTVTVALELFKQLGLIFEEENGILKIEHVGVAVGSESSSKEAEKKRIYRSSQKNIGDASGDKMSPKAGTKCPSKGGTKCPTDIRDKSIENRYKENYIKESSKTEKDDFVVKMPNGEHMNVMLTVEELVKLQNRWGKRETERLIDDLSDYLNQGKGDYKSHYSAINTWARGRELVDLTKAKNTTSDLYARAEKQIEEIEKKEKSKKETENGQHGQ